MKQTSNWVESAGGPLLLAPRSVLLAWHAGSDYQRACAVMEEIGVILIASEQALVLGDEPDRTCLLRPSASEVLIVRWRWAESEAALLSALDQADLDQLPPHLQGSFAAQAGEYVLFDSARGGETVGDEPSVELRGGPHTFDALNFRPDAKTWALIHRLRAQM